MEVMEVGSGIDRNEKATRAKATVLNFVCISGTILHDNIWNVQAITSCVKEILMSNLRGETSVLETIRGVGQGTMPNVGRGVVH